MNRKTRQGTTTSHTVFAAAMVRRLLLPMTAVAALMLGACGSGGEVVAGNDGSTVTETTRTNGNQTGSTQHNGGTDPADGGYQRTESHPELVSAQKAPVLGAEAVDEQTLAVRYSNGSEPCSLARVTVTESETSVTVMLETGLHPNAAAMSCIAQVIDYEIHVPLGEPLGDREIVVDEP